LPPGAAPENVQAIDRALNDRKRIAFVYQSVRDTRATLRRADPMFLRLHDGQLYLIAHDVDRGVRTFKLARIRDVTILAEDAAPHPEYDERSLFAHSARIWTGEPVHVTVRLSARVARFAVEW